MTAIEAAQIYRRVLIDIYDEKDQMNNRFAFTSLFMTHLTNELYADIDQIRRARGIATDVPLLGGRNYNNPGSFTAEVYKMPYYHEVLPLNHEIGYKRRPGQNPYTKDSPWTVILDRITDAMVQLGLKIKRARELQAINSLLNGTFVPDTSGELPVSYNKRATHHSTVTTSWESASSDPLGNIEAMCQNIKKNGKSDPKVMIMGAQAFKAMMSHDDIKDQLDQRHNYTISNMYSMNDNTGLVRRGVITAGTYQLEVLLYEEYYDHPNTGADTLFLPTDKVVIMSDMPHFDMVYGGVPIMVEPDLQARGLIGGMGLGISSMPTMIPGEMIPKVYTDQRGENIEVGMCSRFLAIPLSIDLVATLDVIP